MMFDKLLAFDQVMHKLCIIVNARTADGEAGYNKAVEEIDAFIETLRITEPIPYEKPQKAPEFTCNLSKEEYCSMVEKTKHYIKEGDISRVLSPEDLKRIMKEAFSMHTEYFEPPILLRICTTCRSRICRLQVLHQRPW